MDSKYCSGCIRKLPLSCFPTNASGKVLATCTSCRSAQAKSNKKRKALQELDPNLPSKRCATGPKRATTTPSMLEPRPIAPSLLESRLTPPSEPESYNPPRELESHNPPRELESYNPPSVLESCGSPQIRTNSSQCAGARPKSYFSSIITTTSCTVRKWLPISPAVGVDTDL
jgi:hypothetical protein